MRSICSTQFEHPPAWITEQQVRDEERNVEAAIALNRPVAAMCGMEHADRFTDLFR